MKRYKKIFLFLVCFIFFQTSVSSLQSFYLTKLEIHLFPELRNILPKKISTWIFEDKKNEINENENSFLKPSTTVTTFFAKLKKLEDNKKSKVKILHYGDSLLWGDILTEKLRKNFQIKFGDGGIGLVPIAEYRERYFKGYKNLNSVDFFYKFHLNHRQVANVKLGFLGEGFIPLSTNRLEFHSSYPNIELFTHLDILNDKVNSIVNVNNSIANRYIFEKQVKYSLTSDEYRKIFLFQNLDKEVLDAVSFENDYGLVYSSVARQGIEFSDLKILNKNLLDGIKIYKPDLLVFQFGINEIQNLYTKNQLDYNKYEIELRETVQFLKKLNTEILIISPFERVNESGVVMSESLNLINIQDKICKEENINFLNLYNLLGKVGQNLRLLNNKFLQSDRTHLNREGGDYLADEIFKILDREYNIYLGKKNIEEKVSYEENKNIPILFSSRSYFYFFLLVFLFCICLPRFKILILCISSVYFYATWDINATLLLIFSSLVGYISTRLIVYLQIKYLKLISLTICLIINFGILFYFKYLGFYQELVNFIFSYFEQKPFSEIIKLSLPVGISFYTFQIISYTIDVYRGDLKIEKKFTSYLHYVVFFPQLVAGPIVRAKDFLKDKTEHFPFRYINFSSGLSLVILGLLKKNLADKLAFEAVDSIFTSPEMYSSSDILLGFYSFGAQIYLDFSGYSDIAIGSAKILGYKLNINFNHPYSSSSITEFWRRWHISLGTWFKDYLYIPLGGNQKRNYLNLWLVFFLCGLWHGASVIFVIWGLYHGFFLVIEKLIKINNFKLPKFFSQIITLHIVLIGWILFRANDLKIISSILNTFLKFNFNHSISINIILILIIFYIYQIRFSQLTLLIRKFFVKFEYYLHSIVSVFCISVIHYLSKSGAKAFIYFDF